jgi:hypothetical protein
MKEGRCLLAGTVVLPLLHAIPFDHALLLSLPATLPVSRCHSCPSRLQPYAPRVEWITWLFWSLNKPTPPQHDIVEEWKLWMCNCQHAIAHKTTCCNAANNQEIRVHTRTQRAAAAVAHKQSMRVKSALVGHGDVRASKDVHPSHPTTSAGLHATGTSLHLSSFFRSRRHCPTRTAVLATSTSTFHPTVTQCQQRCCGRRWYYCCCCCCGPLAATKVHLLYFLPPAATIQCALW